MRTFATLASTLALTFVFSAPGLAGQARDAMPGIDASPAETPQAHVSAPRVMQPDWGPVEVLDGDAQVLQGPAFTPAWEIRSQAPERSESSVHLPEALVMQSARGGRSLLAAGGVLFIGGAFVGGTPGTILMATGVVLAAIGVHRIV